MNVSSVRHELIKKVRNLSKHIIEDQAKQLKSYIQYEIAVVNTELAMSSKEHGYDFKFISNDYADQIIISNAVGTEEGKISLRVSIPMRAFDDASEDEVLFFKTYILTNAITRLRRGMR